MRWAILDTSVYIDYWEGRLEEQTLGQVQHAFIIRHSAVVLSELRRGARTQQARRLVESLYGLAKARWTPSFQDWWHAGDIICRIGDARHWDPAKRRDFQNDVLIALTARRFGATIVTCDAADFELLGAELHVQVLSLPAA